MPDVLEFFEKFGLNFENNPNSEELRFLLEKFIEDKRFTRNYLKEYGIIANVALTELYGALRMLIESEKANTAGVQETLRKAIDFLGDIYANRDLSPEQVAACREDVFRIIAEAKEEASETRMFNREVLQAAGFVAGSVAFTTVGVCVTILTIGKYPQMLARGGQMAMKGAEVAKSVWKARRTFGK